VAELRAGELLGDAGPFAAAVEGFAARSQQQAMADAVQDAIEQYDALVVEAGTGVGKTFAYLVPALLSGGKVIVSTGTKTLQDQLFHKDLPVVRRALGINATTALLKGRANYLCLHRLGTALHEAGGVRGELDEVRRWSGGTSSGDIGELPQVPEGSPVWPRVTSTTDNCLGSECPDFASCHVVKARRAAQEADLVVINHHLFMADLVLREEGFGEILPSANALILDEAHQLAEIASDFFGTVLSSRQLIELARDTVAETLNEAPDAVELRDQAPLLEQAAQGLRAVMGPAGRREPWARLAHRPEIESALARLRDTLTDLESLLDAAAERGKGLQACHQRAGLLRARLAAIEDPAPDTVQWFETYPRGFVLHTTPLDIAETFRGRLQAHPCAAVFTSATLAVGSSFQHFTGRLGLEEAQTLQLDSPFDYEQNALIYLPTGLPDPNEPGYTRAVVEAARPLIESAGGRSFLLFTSHRALQEAAGLLQGRIDYPLLIQGQRSRRELIEHFRLHGNAVLLGTSSFWEGVDVRGSALGLVVIDRLPFAAPSDPVLQARIESIRRDGRNPFTALQLPRAVIGLKQGVGRLIRDVDDRGVLMLCDPRITTRPYGRSFLESLPPMPRTREPSVARQFLENAWSVQESEPGSLDRSA
jgi:ATP-dependent DNA helicase DinG